MRKLLSPGLTQCALKTQEPIVHRYVCLLIERLREAVDGAPTGREWKGVELDMVPWCNYTTFDIFGDLGFGESFQCLGHSHCHLWIALRVQQRQGCEFCHCRALLPLIGFPLIECVPESITETQRVHYRQIVDKV